MALRRQLLSRDLRQPGILSHGYLGRSLQARNTSAKIQWWQPVLWVPGTARRSVWLERGEWEVMERRSLREKG